MNRALGYGLMGAAQGFLQGLQGQWQQGQEDIRTEKLAKAKMQELQALEQMKAQYQSQANYEKVMLQFIANSQLEEQKAASAQALQEGKQAFEGQKAASDRASREKVAGISAGATIGAANIRATADALPRQPAPRGEQIWQTPDGRNVLVSGDAPPPETGSLQWASGGSMGARPRGGTPGPLSALNGADGAPVIDGNAGITTPAPTVQAPAPVPAPVAAPASGGFTPAAPAPPMPGAKQAADGNWYVPDPSRPGKYLQVG